MASLSSILLIVVKASVVRAWYAVWTYTLKGLIRTVVMAGYLWDQQLLPVQPKHCMPNQMGTHEVIQTRAKSLHEPAHIQTQQDELCPHNHNKNYGQSHG